MKDLRRLSRPAKAATPTDSSVEKISMPGPSRLQDLGNFAIQRKMKSDQRLGESSDANERSADHAAQRVSESRPAAGFQGGKALPAGQIGSSGERLDDAARSTMEARFGADFGEVRVHSGSEPARAAQAIDARAFAVGSDIVFGEGQYRPETSEGRKLLAHELAHTLQPGSTMRRSAISDDIQKAWDASPTLETLLARLARADVQGAPKDADIDAKIASLLSNPDDLYLAQAIRRGQVGKTAQGRAVEATFVQGSTNKRALVIAGVHGSEGQGIEVARMLIADLAAATPAYSVIIVPSLFPDNAATGTREQPGTQTNRNFPAAGKTLATTQQKAGAPLDALGAPILAENIMLLHLIEKFKPERIISIHGTRYSGAGGVFYDPLTLNAADEARARKDAKAMAFMEVPVEKQSTFEGQEMMRRLEEKYYQMGLTGLAHRDRDPSLRAAEQIDKATTGITGRENRTFLREKETGIGATEKSNRAAHPSVAGNVGPSGKLDTGFWSGSSPAGVSLGGYASSRGISIFTVEPPLNLQSSVYPTGKDTGLDKAERLVELKAYADAIETVLLGR